MKGKLGIIIGFGAGYVLGTRAGRERFEQIKEQASSLWNSRTVQKQVDKVKDLGKSSVAALPTALWNGAVKVTEAVRGEKSTGDKLDDAVDAGRSSAKDVSRGAKKTGGAIKDGAEDVKDHVSDAVDNAKDAAKSAADDVKDAADDAKKASDHDGN